MAESRRSDKWGFLFSGGTMSARNDDPWTVQKRFGFADDDLKTSLHDDIVFWVGENALSVVDKCFYQSNLFRDTWSDEEITKIKYQFEKYQSNDNYHSGWPEFYRKYQNVNFSRISIPDRGKSSIRNIVFEYVIQNGKYTVGFVDVFIELLQPCLHLSTENGIESDYEVFSCALEIKGQIESFGQLLRQVRLYQQYLKVPFGVVSPDDQFEKMLKSQNVGFVKYPK